MRHLLLALVLAAVAPRPAAADPDPKRTVAVLEYRAGSSALPGFAARVVALLSSRTSLRVLAQDQARTMYGDHLGQALVACAGAPACIARIGQKVGAAEVIVIGVSELGDVILTMQRVDVRAQAVASRVADSLATGAMPGDDQIAAYATRLLPPGDFVRFGVVDVVANLSGAAVIVGGEPRGTTPLAALTLRAPARYEIRVEKRGYVPFRTTVALPPDGAIKVEAQLSRRGGEVAWYQRWYVLAAAGIVVAGAGGTAIYFGTRAPGGDGQLSLTATTR